MDAATRAQMRKRLVTLRDELIEKGKEKIPPARTDAVAQPDEDEAPLTEMSQAIASSRNRQRGQRLTALIEALTLLDEDPEEYGMCETCEEPIGKRRLELMPWVSLCVACQEKLERDGPSSRRRNLTDYR